MRTHNETHIGALGWGLTALGIGVWDLTQEETMTHAFSRGMENKYSRPFVIGALAVTALHLLDVLPHHPIETDPFNRLGAFVTRHTSLENNPKE